MIDYIARNIKIFFTMSVCRPEKNIDRRARNWHLSTLHTDIKNNTGDINQKTSTNSREELEIMVFSGQKIVTNLL